MAITGHRYLNSLTKM